MLIPTRPLDLAGNGEGEVIPPDTLSKILTRLSSLETAVMSINTATANLNVRLSNLETASKEEEHCFFATNYVYPIDGVDWRLVGGVAIREETDLIAMSGYANTWGTNSEWKLVGIRHSGTQDVQSVTKFSFDIIPSFSSLRYSNEDLVGILVRVFEDDGTTLDTNSMVLGSITLRKLI